MDTESRQAPLWGLFLAFAAVYIVWGSTYLAIRVTIETIPPLLSGAVRFLIAGGILYAFRISKQEVRPTAKQWLWATLVGGLMLGGGNGGVVWAEQYIPSGVTALIVSSVPFWMVLMDWWRGARQAPSLKTALGIVIGFAGVGILVGAGQEISASTVPWLPMIVLVMASCFWSIGSLISRTADQPKGPLLFTGMQMLGGSAVMLVLSLLRGEILTFDPAGVSSRSLVGLVYLIILGSIVTYSAYMWLLKTVSAAAVSTYAFVNPGVAVFLGWLLANEPLTPRIGVSSALIVIAVMLVTIRRPRRRPKPPGVGS